MPEIGIAIGIGIGIGIEKMVLGHEKLDVYRLAIGYVAWVFELDRMAAMLSRLGGRGYQVGEGSGMYESTKNDFDPDPDSDPDLS